MGPVAPGTAPAHAPVTPFGALTDDALLVVGDAGFQAAMRANPHLAGRLLLGVSVEEALTGDLRVEDVMVVVSASARHEIAAHRRPEFPGAAVVVVVPDGEEVDDPFGSPLSRRQQVLKRLFDVVVGAVLLVLAAPVVLVLALVVRWTMRESGIFVQERVGAAGRRIRIRKIRSMVTADDSAQRDYTRAHIGGRAQPVSGMFKLVDDERITPLGRRLRRLSLDELPQLWNVVRGDMSLVGPRPPLPSDVALYDAMAWQRLRVKPGITGPWQVNGRCTLSFAEMVELDIAYWQRWSLGRDVVIALRTPLEMLSGRGAA